VVVAGLVMATGAVEAMRAVAPVLAVGVGTVDAVSAEAEPHAARAKPITADARTILCRSI
jgi:hypothetical protein